LKAVEERRKEAEEHERGRKGMILNKVLGPKWEADAS